MALTGYALRLHHWARSLIPVTLSLLLVLVAILPLPVPYYSVVAPALPLMAVYYWSVYRPDLMPHVAVFIIGLLVDIFAGTPIGVNALVLLLVQVVVAAQRRFLVGKSFWMLWLGFLLVAPGALALTWLLISALAWTLVAPVAILFQLLVTMGVFPWFAWLLLKAQRNLLAAE